MSSWAGNLIRLARRERGLSQRDLARRAATSQAAIAAYESGRRSPSLETLARIVRAAGLDLRIRMEPLDDHDAWLSRYEANLPPDVVHAWRERDRELLPPAPRK
jgi:transcriptional regulator with XRE-family HTH domain